MSMLPGVLIIDDDCSLLEAYTVLLAEDFRVVTATTGGEGLARLQCEDVDVVLLDVRLPGMDGLEVLGQIKARHAHIEVLMLTASHEPHLVRLARQCGAADYLVKPVDNANLLIRLQQAARCQEHR
jgi:DNA-binding response OmpR family regulator